MLLSNLSKNIDIKKIYNFTKDSSFKYITSNSKLVNNETIFIYNSNNNVKIKYAREAIKNKTPAIISNKFIKNIKTPQFVVSNINLESEKLLKQIHKNLPSKIIAVTGTNGKTSVVWYISQILTFLKYNNSSVGTLGYFKNCSKKDEVKLTTPAYEELYKYGSSHKKEKNIYIFEASSHALDQNRLRKYQIDIAAITNISNDHLDYHKNISNYKKSKFKLFTKHLSKSGSAIINSRIKNTLSLRNKLIKNKILIKYFGRKFIYLEKKYDSIVLNIYKKKYIIKKLNLNTDIELENLECAITCLLELDIKINNIISVLSKVKNPLGRLQKLNYNKKKSLIIIDYAHTPDALKRTLISLRKKSIKPNLLFGCGGERDKTKRKTMGLIAKYHANRIYITDDNPRNENPKNIRKSILKHCPNAIEIPNRKIAIKKAINDLKVNETLLIAGKGHEKVQIIKNEKIKFDDYEIAKNTIEK